MEPERRREEMEGKYQRRRKREREEEKEAEIANSENPEEAEALHLLRKYRSRSTELEKAKSKQSKQSESVDPPGKSKKPEKSSNKIDRAKSKKLAAAKSLLEFNVLPVTTSSEMATVAELWKFWRTEHLKLTTGMANRIRVAILAEEEQVIQKIQRIATENHIEATPAPAQNYR